MTIARITSWLCAFVVQIWLALKWCAWAAYQFANPDDDHPTFV
jgi:hypothetical protein